MFQLAFISIITLRVLLCPLLCVGDDGARALGVEQSVMCACSGNENEACRGDKLPPFGAPCDCPIPCDSGCVCQFTPESNSRVASADIELSVDFVPVCFSTRNSSDVLPCEERPRRLDFKSGRTIRLIFASLLI